MNINKAPIKKHGWVIKYFIISADILWTNFNALNNPLIGFLTPEDGNDMLSRKVCKKLPILAPL
jgi:hypothetical protein